MPVASDRRIANVARMPSTDLGERDGSWRARPHGVHGGRQLGPVSLVATPAPYALTLPPMGDHQLAEVIEHRHRAAAHDLESLLRVRGVTVG